MNEKANIKEALSLLESALNILRDGVIPKDGEEDTVDDWIEDYGEFLRHNVDAMARRRS